MMTLSEIARQAAAKSRGIPLGVFDDIADAVLIAVGETGFDFGRRTQAAETVSCLNGDPLSIQCDPTAQIPDRAGPEPRPNKEESVEVTITRTVNKLVDGYDAKFWRDSYALLRDAVCEHLAPCDDDVAEEAIMVKAIELAGKRLIENRRHILGEAQDAIRDNCGMCDGHGFTIETGTGSGHACDGTEESCLQNCPVPFPVQKQAPCEYCGRPIAEIEKLIAIKVATGVSEPASATKERTEISRATLQPQLRAGEADPRDDQVTQFQQGESNGKQLHDGKQDWSQERERVHQQSTGAEQMAHDAHEVHAHAQRDAGDGGVFSEGRGTDREGMDRQDIAEPDRPADLRDDPSGDSRQESK